MTPLDLTDPSSFALSAAVAVLAGLVRGFTGFGGPAVIILSLMPFFAPASVIPKVLVIDYVANLHLVPATARDIHLPLAVALIGGSLIGLPLGALLLDTLDPVVMKRAIALVAGGCTLLMMVGFRSARLPPFALHLVLGIVAGVVLGASLIAFVAVLYLLAMPINASAGRATMVMWGFVTSSVLLSAYLWVGILDWPTVWRAIMIGMVYLAGVTLGDRVFKRVSERDFRRVVLWFLLGLSTMGLVL